MTMAGTSSGLRELFYYSLVTSLYLVALYTDNIIYTEKRFEKAGLNLHSSFGGRAKFLTLIGKSFGIFSAISEANNNQLYFFKIRYGKYQQIYDFATTSI